MNKKYISPFKPRKINNVKTSGIKIYTFNAGYKKFKDDLLIIVFEKPVGITQLYLQNLQHLQPLLYGIRNNIKKISVKF